jgi:hypothetical protein
MASKLNSMPVLPRMIIGAILFFGGMYLLMRLWVTAAIEDTIDASPDEITYESTFLRFNGEFGMEGVKGTHPLPDGSEKGYSADRVIVHTPGLLWLARVGWKGSSGELPDDFGVTVENFRVDSDNDRTPGNYSNLPFDAVGCGKRLLTPADLTEMGLFDLDRNITVRLTRLDDSSSNMKFAMDTPGVGSMSMDMELGIERPLEWADGPAGLIEAPVKTGKVTLTDQGFIAARNAFCAKKAGIDVEAFADHHMRALDTHLAEEGLTLGIGALDRYKAFAQKGGEITITTVGDTKLTLGDLSGPTLKSRLSSVRTGIRHDGGPLANFEMGTRTPIERVDPEDLVAQAAAAPTAVATAATGAPAPPTGKYVPRSRTDNLTGTEVASRPRIVVTTGDLVAYKDLDKHIGERIQITTKMGTVRHGTLLVTNSFQSHIKLDAEEGGFNLVVPSDTVREVRLIPGTN